MNDFRVDAISLLTGVEPEEGMFVDWMFDIFFFSSLFFVFLFLGCCELLCRIQGKNRFSCKVRSWLVMGI